MRLELTGDFYPRGPADPACIICGAPDPEHMIVLTIVTHGLHAYATTCPVTHDGLLCDGRRFSAIADALGDATLEPGQRYIDV